MAEPTQGIFKRNLGVIILLTLLGVYILVAGTTGSCPSCSAITSIIGLNDSGARKSNAEGADMSTWALVTLEGDAITSSSLKGKVVIMDFWATWCPPCRKEIPSFIALQEAYGDKGLVVLGVSLDDGGPQVVRAFADKAGINYPLAMGNRDILKAAGGVEALPTTLIINRDGDVVDKHVGYASKETFEKAIQPLL